MMIERLRALGEQDAPTTGDEQKHRGFSRFDKNTLHFRRDFAPLLTRGFEMRQLKRRGQFKFLLQLHAQP